MSHAEKVREAHRRAMEAHRAALNLPPPEPAQTDNTDQAASGG